MRTIDLSHVRNTVLSPLLQVARAPLLEKLFIVAGENDNSVVPRLQASNSILGIVIRNNISKNVVLRATASNAQFYFELGTFPETHGSILQITSRGGQWRDVVGELAEFHSIIAQHKIPVELRLDSDLAGDYTFLAALSTLASMVITGPVSSRTVESLFHFLGKGLPGQKEATKLPCPRLAKLDVEGDNSLYKAASSLIKTRQGLANIAKAPVQRLRVRLSGTEVFAF
ncbi:hypothetical protein FS837_000557 [Tulasnella sp. UAMH 9824]|nr:hypothetical protein FS837_000557 [Tulasnella sp. UAMH 9824]